MLQYLASIWRCLDSNPCNGIWKATFNPLRYQHFPWYIYYYFCSRILFYFIFSPQYPWEYDYIIINTTSLMFTSCILLSQYNYFMIQQENADGPRSLWLSRLHLDRAVWLNQISFIMVIAAALRQSRLSQTNLINTGVVWSVYPVRHSFKSYNPLLLANFCVPGVSKL